MVILVVLIVDILMVVDIVMVIVRPLRAIDPWCLGAGARGASVRAVDGDAPGWLLGDRGVEWWPSVRGAVVLVVVFIVFFIIVVVCDGRARACLGVDHAGVARHHDRFTASTLEFPVAESR